MFTCFIPSFIWPLRKRLYIKRLAELCRQRCKRPYFGLRKAAFYKTKNGLS